MERETSSLRADRIRTLDATGRAYLDHLRLLGRSEATLRARGNALRQFGKFWGGRDVREARPADLDAYAAELRGHLARESLYQYLDSVRALFRYLTEAHVILVDPSRALPMPSMKARRVGRIPTPEEMKRAIERVDVGTPSGLRDRAMLEFLYSTGLRSSEARRLDIEHVTEDAVTVRAGKGGKDRRVPLGAHAHAWIVRYLGEARPQLARPDEKALWVMDRGRRFGEAWFCRHVRVLGAAAGVAKLTCHAVRRSMATHMLAAGANPVEVAAILGHEDLSSLSRYASLAGGPLKEEHARTHPREEKP